MSKKYDEKQLKILKNAYVRRSKNGQRIDVSSGGKAKKKQRTLPKLGNDLELSTYGYTLKKTKQGRERALRKASKKNSTLPVLRRLNLIRNYSIWHSKNYKKLSEDVEYMKRYYRTKKPNKN